MRAIPIFPLILILALQPLATLADSDLNGESQADIESDSGLIEVVPNDFAAAQDYSYEEIDRHALEAPASAEESIESLAAYLIEPAKNDREKARAIFRWICENIDYDVDVFFSGKTGPTDSVDVLKSKKSICFGYSDLFISLASEAGLEAVRISGYGKGYGYMPGTSFSGPTNHAWNAVKINGSWYLLDCTWGAGYANSDKEYVRHFDDHFFMTPPSEFVFDHFPVEEKWQLLDHPISIEEYESLVYLDSDFFNLGLRLDGQKNGTIKARGEVNISIYAPEDVLMMVGLDYADSSTSARESLDGYALCQRAGEQYDLLAKPPLAGSYILKAYGKKKTDPGDYNSVLKYRIEADSADDVSVGYPTTYSKFDEAGAHLMSPLEGKLQAGKSYWFGILVPGAEDVAVVCGKEWTHLAKDGDLFEGNATAEKGDVGLYANFGGGKWDGMVGYACR